MVPTALHSAFLKDKQRARTHYNQVTFIFASFLPFCSPGVEARVTSVNICKSEFPGGSILDFHHVREVMFFFMIADGGDDLQRQSQRPAAIFQGNNRCGSLPHGVEKRLKLSMERLF